MIRQAASSLLLGLSCLSANAVTLTAVDRGYYDSSGSHTPGSLNYIVGDDNTSTVEFRNFFVFDLTSVSGTVTSASLHLQTAVSVSYSPSETYGIFDVGTSIGSLTGGTGGTGAFADLGTGTALGSVTVTSASAGPPYDFGGTIAGSPTDFIDVTLNAAGLAYLNANLGGLVAVGGALTSLNGVNDMSDAEYLFGASNVLGNCSPGSCKTELVLATVPIPAAAWLFGGALGVLGVLGRRQAMSSSGVGS